MCPNKYILVPCTTKDGIFFRSLTTPLVQKKIVQSNCICVHISSTPLLLVRTQSTIENRYLAPTFSNPLSILKCYKVSSEVLLEKDYVQLCNPIYLEFYNSKTGSSSQPYVGSLLILLCPEQGMATKFALHRAVFRVTSGPADIQIFPTFVSVVGFTHVDISSSSKPKLSSAPLQVKSSVPTYATFIIFLDTYASLTNVFLILRL